MVGPLSDNDDDGKFTAQTKSDSYSRDNRKKSEKNLNFYRYLPCLLISSHLDESATNIQLSLVISTLLLLLL